MKQQIWHAVVIGLLLLSPLGSRAQSAQSVKDPSLHHRGDPSTTDRPVVVRRGRTNSAIPEEASGEYKLGPQGELIQIIMQFGDLSGYISRQGDGESDSGTPLTFFFEQTSMRGQELKFTTQQIHGVWYSFQGTIVRGPGKTRGEDGYYLLTGDLIVHDSTQKTESLRTVSLKSGRQLG
jgi:hypothetical protein